MTTFQHVLSKITVMAQSFIRFSLSWDDSICHIFHVKFSLCRFYTNPLEFEVEKTHQKFQDSVQKLLFGVKNNQISLYNVLISSIEHTEVKSRVFFLKLICAKTKTNSTRIFQKSFSIESDSSFILCPSPSCSSNFKLRLVKKQVYICMHF